ncbi:MAG: Deoxyribodipyrimidine photo-lyase [Chlamydiia bacterium]|nr:Deoxyribodipyrimidine photo-lyase [Chlamydiia bacterium]
METTLFIFRRDLRLEDNTGLNYALKESKRVIPCFIFTPEQIEKNAYRSDGALQFLIESLEELDSELKKKGSKLYLFYGKPDEVVKRLIKEMKLDGVVFNRDYTPYSIKRDNAIERICKQQKIEFASFDDVLLVPPEESGKANGEPYTIFTPFFKTNSKHGVQNPKRIVRGSFYKGNIQSAKPHSLFNKLLPQRYEQVKGGRKAAMKILANLKKFSAYHSMRDFPAKEGSTQFSPHLKFTTVSPREVYHAIRSKLGKSSELIRALYWRDFYTQIAYFYPEVFGHAFQKKFDKLPWENNRSKFKKWCEGNTGFPIIDAGMRELNETGLMHNRVRMIVASFLIKHLHIDWRWGEKYFAQTLIDYDPAVNNGNWQWVASTGCDAQPYFRIFNPWLQQKRFDPDCEYIKKWVPELNQLEPKVIHSWFKEDRPKNGVDYPRPMLVHETESKKALAAYKRAT